MEQSVTASDVSAVRAKPDIAGIFEALTSAGRSSYLHGVTGACRFDLTDDGKWLVTVNDGKLYAEQRPGDADCVFKCSSEDLRQMVSGEMSGLAAVLRGRIDVTGDLAMAMRIQRIFAITA